MKQQLKILQDTNYQVLSG